MNLVSRLTRLDTLLAKCEGAALAALVVVMTLIVFLQVIHRYVLAQPLHWSEEAARYLFVWLSMLGAALAVQKRGHFGIDFFFRMLPRRWRRLAGILILVLMEAVVVVILVEGMVLVARTASQESPAMSIPMSWPYACVPVAAALMAVHLAVILLKDAAGREQPDPGHR
jgi:TRAP-type C4-dicarboxylate transport system permease small subunit